MTDAIISVNNLSIGYKNHRVMDNVSFSIRPGELVGIIGCNGAGKSTLLKSIRGILPLQQGQVNYYNKPLQAYKEKELAQKIAYLQQNVEVGFGFTAEDIVLAGRYPYLNWMKNESELDKKIAHDCMTYTGTLDLKDVSINNVSGGQKQRILLAKVLAQQTPILFLDEPTTGLDLVYQEEIFEFAKELSSMGKTILMVVHELDLAYKYCSRIILLGKGRVLADAMPQEVFKDEILSEAYAADIHIIENPLTGNIELSANAKQEEIKHKRQLLEKICNYNGNKEREYVQ